MYYSKGWSRTWFLHSTLCLCTDDGHKNVNLSSNFCWTAAVYKSILLVLCFRLFSWPKRLYLARGRLRWPGQAWLLPAASRFPSGCVKWQQGVRVVSFSEALPRDQLTLRTGFMPWSPARENTILESTCQTAERLHARVCQRATVFCVWVCWSVLWDLVAMDMNIYHTSKYMYSVCVCVCDDSAFTADFGCL